MQIGKAKSNLKSNLKVLLFGLMWVNMGSADHFLRLSENRLNSKHYFPLVN